MPDFRVFLSAVTSEFGKARDALANDLQPGNAIVRVQRSFRHDPDADTLLHKLHNYVRQCNVVVCLVGTRSGAGFPTAPEAEPFRAILPAGVNEASYTQWEFYFARHFNRPCLVYFAATSFRRDKRDASSADRPGLQTAFASFIKSLGLQWTPVASRDQFRAEALKDLLHLRLPPALSASLTEKLAAVVPRPILLPYPTLGPLFKGRDTFLDRLHDTLRTGNAAAINGMGGIGKTRTAVEYAWAHRDGRTAIALLDAETQDRLQSSLAALAAPLRLPAQSAPEEAIRFEAVLDWLNTNPGWLLILDNIDTAAALTAAHRLLGRLSGGQVILTSRLTMFPTGIRRLDLDLLTPEAATAFLQDATPARPQTPDDAEQARLLANDLGHLALALEMAAATIQARRLTLAAYRALWQTNRGRVLGWTTPQITTYHHAVAETWQTSIMQLTAEGRRLLEHLSFLAPEPVPTTLLDVPVPTGADTPKAEDPGQHAALADLTTNSLATLDPGSETFVIHRLVQDVTRRGLAQAGTAHQRLTETLASPAKKISLHHDVGHVLRPLTMFGHQAAPHGMSVPNPVGRRHFLLVTIRNSLLHNAVRQ